MSFNVANTTACLFQPVQLSALSGDKVMMGLTSLFPSDSEVANTTACLFQPGA